MSVSPNMRLFLQAQSGVSEVNRGSRAQVNIPGEYTGNAVVLGQHQVAKGSVLLIKPVSHKPRKYYDPSVDGQCGPLGAVAVTAPVAVADPVVEEEELNLQGFTAKQQMSSASPFADIGIITEDDDVLAEDEDASEAYQPTNEELNAPNQTAPEDLFAELLERGAKGFGISKEELSALKLTRKQVKALYTDVTGRNPGNVTIPKMKSRVRAVAGGSYADYTRVMSAIKKVML